ncbi:MAG: recombination mediator RecR [Candidatus Pacebacteria bacterium]|nr:recombination mediator RecR [Candidatus Paceibacterota bacterium]
MLAPSIEQLIKIFAKFPTIGPKTAARFVFYLLDSPASTTDELIKSVQDLKSKIKICPLCQKFFENQTAEICEICSNPARDKSLICLVEKEIDLEAIEKTATFKGLYFILGGTLSILKKESQEQKLALRLSILIERIKKNGVKEIILALNSTVEGQNTILWLKRKLEGCNIKISQLAQGIPLGGEIEYADEETITSAFEGRK